MGCGGVFDLNNFFKIGFDFESVEWFVWIGEVFDVEFLFKVFFVGEVFGLVVF